MSEHKQPTGAPAAAGADSTPSDRTMFVAIVVLLGVTVGLDYFVHTDPHFHPHFEIEETFGFYAGLSVLSGLGLVVFAKLWSFIVGRSRGYYSQASPDKEH